VVEQLNYNIKKKEIWGYARIAALLLNCPNNVRDDVVVIQQEKTVKKHPLRPWVSFYKILKCEKYFPNDIGTRGSAAVYLLADLTIRNKDMFKNFVLKLF